jgi:hypothetical protein
MKKSFLIVHFGGVHERLLRKTNAAIRDYAEGELMSCVYLNFLVGRFRVR